MEMTFPTLESVDTRDLRKTWMGLPIILAYQGIFVGILVYLFVSGYQSSLSTEYLSPIGTASSTQICAEVEVSLNSEFLVDSSGYWNGAESFDYSNAIYDLTFVSATADAVTYENIIDTFSSQLEKIGDKSRDRDLAWNLVAWSSFRSTERAGSGKAMLTSTGDASTIFNQNLGLFAVANPNKLCTNDMQISYDFAKSVVDLSISVSETFSTKGMGGMGSSISEPCSSVFSVVDDFDYESNKGFSSADVMVDVRSLSTAIAVNFGLLNITDLVQVSAVNISMSLPSISSTPLTFLSYIDPLYPGMKPIICTWFDSSSSDTEISSSVCVLYSGSTWFFPVTTHSGLSLGDCWRNEACSPAFLRSRSTQSGQSVETTPAPTAAPTAAPNYTCPSYYATSSISAECIFQACAGEVLTISGCSQDGGSCEGDTYFSLAIGAGPTATTVTTDDDTCGYCSKITYTVPQPTPSPTAAPTAFPGPPSGPSSSSSESTKCYNFTLTQSCYSTYCTGITALSARNITGNHPVGRSEPFVYPMNHASPTPSPTVAPDYSSMCDTFDILTGTILRICMRLMIFACCY